MPTPGYLAHHPRPDHAAYLAHWVAILKARPGALLEASGHAQRAVDFLLGFSAGTDADAP